MIDGKAPFCSRKRSKNDKISNDMTICLCSLQLSKQYSGQGADIPVHRGSQVALSRQTCPAIRLGTSCLRVT